MYNLQAGWHLKKNCSHKQSFWSTYCLLLLLVKDLAITFSNGFLSRSPAAVLYSFNPSFNHKITQYILGFCIGSLRLCPFFYRCLAFMEWTLKGSRGGLKTRNNGLFVFSNCFLYIHWIKSLCRNTYSNLKLRYLLRKKKGENKIAKYINNDSICKNAPRSR